ncbi:MAG: efflux RND transporter periplasmic adaptor subunit [Campylobacterales bacterium]|nr:efflux RND transporter periplasmic adaptor subunit [Campylobacterales bacterium]
MRTKLSLALVALLLILGAFGLYQTRLEAQASLTPPAPPIKPTAAVHSSAPQQRSFLAELRSDQEVQIGSKIAGFITALHVSEGSRVSKGALLVELDEAELLFNLEALQSQYGAQELELHDAQERLRRDERLFEAGGVAREKLEGSQTLHALKQSALETTRSKMEILNHQRSYTRIAAPFEGVVGSVTLHEGEMAGSTKPILTLLSSAQHLRFRYLRSVDPIALGEKVYHDGTLIGSIEKHFAHSEGGLDVAQVKLDRALEYSIHSHLRITIGHP